MTGSRVKAPAHLFIPASKTTINSPRPAVDNSRYSPLSAWLRMTSPLVKSAGASSPPVNSNPSTFAPACASWSRRHIRHQLTGHIGICRNKTEADGSFFYAVKTTGVYCRPSCPSRQPLRKNVSFYESREAAEEDGYRPCKRRQPGGGTLDDDYARKVAVACRLIEESEEAPTLDELARSASMSKFHFHRIFVQLTGLTPKSFAKARRAERVRQELRKAVR